MDIIQKNLCNGCQACNNACPIGCISMKPDQEGFLYPEINDDICIQCGKCKDICPVNNNKEITKGLQQAFAAYSVDNDIIATSSSGGIFTLFAAEIIKNGGVVFGAVLNGNLQVMHRYADTTEDLKLFRGSKYVQSNIGDSYKETEKFLKNGTSVYFSGTPCQNAGLKAYLGKDYPNLFLQDIICYGVPSPLVWERNLSEKQKEHQAAVISAEFRNKNEGWRQFSIKYTYGNNDSECRQINKDPFMRGFLNNLYLRPSCYNCSFKSENRISDITLADYWGVWDVEPLIYNKQGVSLVILHSEKGALLWDKIKDQTKYKITDLHAALQYNKAALYSAAVSEKKRKRFWRDFYKKTLRKNVDSILKVNILKRIIRKLLRRF